MYLPWLFRWFSRVDTRQCHFGLYPKYYFSTQLRFLCFLFGNDTLSRASFLGCFVTKLCARTAAGVLNLIADGDATGHHTRASLPREPAGQTAASVPRLSHTAMARFQAWLGCQHPHLLALHKSIFQLRPSSRKMFRSYLLLGGDAADLVEIMNKSDVVHPPQTLKKIIIDPVIKLAFEPIFFKFNIVTQEAK